MQKKKEQSNEELYGELGQAFNFTQGDLEANRAGLISFRQKEEILDTLFYRLLPPAYITVVAAAILSLAVYAWFHPPGNYFFLSLCTIGTGLSVLIPSGFMVILSISTKLDLARQRISHARCKPISRKEKELTYFYLQKGKRHFEISSTQWLKLGDREYEVYYLQFTHKIVSVEEALAE